MTCIRSTAKVTVRYTTYEGDEATKVELPAVSRCTDSIWVAYSEKVEKGWESDDDY
jgi:hypothetical protein